MKPFRRKTAKGVSTSAPMSIKAPSIAAKAPSHEEIARRSYELFLERGGQVSSPVQAVEDWLKAEAELSRR